MPGGKARLGSQTKSLEPHRKQTVLSRCEQSDMRAKVQCGGLRAAPWDILSPPEVTCSSQGGLGTWNRPQLSGDETRDGVRG